MPLAVGCGFAQKASDTVSGKLSVTASGPAMEPTIKQGSRVSARRSEGDYVPRRGDLVVYRSPKDWANLSPGGVYISRVVGAPGDRVACCDASGALLVNGQVVKEPFIKNAPASHIRFDVTVPPDRIWLMSDNRHVALDSRAQLGSGDGGTVSRSDVLAVVEGWESP